LAADHIPRRNVILRVLGIDPGIATTGYSVVEGDGDQLTLLTYGVVTTAAGRALSDRLLDLFRDLNAIVAEWKPESAAVEELFFSKNVRTALSVGHARGVALLSLANAGLLVSEYKPAEVKEAITGYGAAPKRQVQLMVQQLLGLPQIPRPDDAADAVAVAICHLHSARWQALVQSGG
jgi:crossover junction endodeoxyribonuclease RuvC